MRLCGPSQRAHLLRARRVLFEGARVEAREVMQVVAETRARLALEVGRLVPQLALPRFGAGDAAEIVVDRVRDGAGRGVLVRVEVDAEVVAEEEHVPEEAL
eukprot:5985504-Prymnesium_polylepis.1